MPAEDSAWKEILELYFRQFLAFFFPDVHREIDWRKPLEFLDKEIQGLFPDLDTGENRVDAVVKATLRNGSGQWLLAHVEVQGRPEEHFDRRILRYNIRISIRCEQDVLSLVVATDSSPSFRPGLYQLRVAGMDLSFRFPTVKIIDYAHWREWLERNTNPFSIVVLAHLDAPKATDDRQRHDLKFALTRKLYNRGYTRKNIQRLFRFLDWILRLPTKLDIEFHERVRTEIEGRQAMPYLAQYEQRAIEKGRAEGRQEGLELGLFEAIERGLELRFGAEGRSLLPRVRELRGADSLRRALEAILSAERIEDLRRLLAES